jgi:PqqD family protein of HPr-rel-A system
MGRRRPGGLNSMPVTRPKVRDDLTLAELDGETVVYDDSTGHLHYLNTTATLVFHLCDGSGTIKELAADVADVYQLGEETVEKQIRTLVGRFRRAGLLQPTARRATAAAGSRRG